MIFISRRLVFHTLSLFLSLFHSRWFQVKAITFCGDGNSNSGGDDDGGSGSSNKRDAIDKDVVSTTMEKAQQHTDRTTDTFSITQNKIVL